VGGVKVAPEARGGGIGRALMTELLGVLARSGFSLSVLFPATLRIYRSLGWELAGARYRIKVPVRSLASLAPADPEVPVLPGEPQGQVRPRRVGPGDADDIIAVLRAVYAAARECGPTVRDPEGLRRLLAQPDLFAYLASDGFLAYGWHGGGHDEIMIRTLAAASACTSRALWGIVASHTSVTRVVHAISGPADPVGWLLGERDVSLSRDEQWMLRVLDPPAAVEARGFPATAQAAVPLLLADPDLPGNAGRYVLEVAHGRGALSASDGQTAPAARSRDEAPVGFGPRGFAALYAGVPMATLRAAGLAAGGGPRSDGMLDAVFAAQPYMLDRF
jgi:predicted acetyltransferase